MWEEGSDVVIPWGSGWCMLHRCPERCPLFLQRCRTRPLGWIGVLLIVGGGIILAMLGMRYTKSTKTRIGESLRASVRMSACSGTSRSLQGDRHILPLYESGDTDGASFYVMPNVPVHVRRPSRLIREIA